MKDNTGILCLQLSGLSLMTMIVVKNVKNAVLSAVLIFLFCKFARFGQTD